MAFSEAERVIIRAYLGYSGFSTQLDSRLESAITAVQAKTEGGTALDGSIEAYIRGLLTDLTALEGTMKSMWSQAQAVDADGLKLDVARALAVLRGEGRRLVGRLADVLSITPLRNVFHGKGSSS